MKVSNSNSSQQKTVLSVKALTWLRDSHGLFDYETFQLTKNSLNVSSDCNLIRCGNEVRTLSCPALGEFETIGKLQIREGNSSRYS